MEDRQIVDLFWARSEVAITEAQKEYYAYCLAIAKRLLGDERDAEEVVNDAFLAAFDKDAEDYSLTVTSAGLDQPFKVLRQYEKALGSLVEVRLKGGRKLTGVLTKASEEGISLRYSQKEAVEGSKKKVTVEHEDDMPFAEINSVVPHIVFKD